MVVVHRAVADVPVARGERSAAAGAAGAAAGCDLGDALGSDAQESGGVADGVALLGEDADQVGCARGDLGFVLCELHAGPPYFGGTDVEVRIAGAVVVDQFQAGLCALGQVLGQGDRLPDIAVEPRQRPRPGVSTGQVGDIGQPRELNLDTRPGRFVLTGSTRHDALPAAAQALTGRLHRMTIYPFTQGERAGVREHLLADLFADPAGAVPAPRSPTSKADYIARIVAGGLPLALARTTEASRNRWFDDYVWLTLERDVSDLSRVRQAAMLPRLLDRLAGQTAQVLNVAKAAQSIGLEVRSATNYIRLLEAVFLLQRLPAWGTTLAARANTSPKIHVVDSGVAVRLLRLMPATLGARNVSALAELGHLLVSFAVGELLRQASWMDGLAGCGHWRTQANDEVDLVVERDDGAVVAFEVKSRSRIPGEDLRPLRKLRDLVGEGFLAGVVLYLGEHSYTIEDRLHALPVDRIWAP